MIVRNQRTMSITPKIHDHKLRVCCTFAIRCHQSGESEDSQSCRLYLSHRIYYSTTREFIESLPRESATGARDLISSDITDGI